MSSDTLDESSQDSTNWMTKSAEAELLVKNTILDEERDKALFQNDRQEKTQPPCSLHS